MSKDRHSDGSGVLGSGGVGSSVLGSGVLNKRGDLYEAVDAWGPEVTEWRDRTIARRAREALLADRTFRAYRDGATRIAAELDTAAAALDERIADSGAVDRISRNVLAAAQPRRIHWHRRAAAIAAVLVISAVLGGAYETKVPAVGHAPSEVQVVQLDPIVFGMSEPDF